MSKKRGKKSSGRDIFTGELKYNKIGNPKVLSQNWFEQKVQLENTQKLKNRMNNVQTYGEVMKSNETFTNFEDAQKNKKYFPKPKSIASIVIGRDGKLKQFFHDSSKKSKTSIRNIESTPMLIGDPDIKEFSTINSVHYDPNNLKKPAVGKRSLLRERKIMELALQEEVDRLKNEIKQKEDRKKEIKFGDGYNRERISYKKDVKIDSLYNEQPVSFYSQSVDKTKNLTTVYHTKIGKNGKNIFGRNTTFSKPIGEKYVEEDH